MKSEFESNYSNPHPVIYLAHSKKQKKRKIKKLLCLFVVLTIFFSGITIIYSAGYIPIIPLLETRAPRGAIGEISINEFAKFYPKILYLPILEKVKFRIYGSNEPYGLIENEYTKILSKEGYSYDYYGSENIANFQIRSYGYVKGLTAVGIIIVSNARRVFGYETIVLYSTGNALDYKDLVDSDGSILNLIY